MVSRRLWIDASNLDRLTDAGAEVLANMVGVGGNGLTVGLAAVSALGVPTFCGRDANGNSWPLGCIEPTPPVINTTIEILGESDGNVLFSDTGAQFLPLFNATINNVFQTMDAAVRLDFGPTISNNFLTNPEVAPLTLFPTFPILTLDANGTISSIGDHPSVLYQVVAGTFFDPSQDIVSLPLDGSQLSRMQVPYLCHFSVRKSTGSLIIAVLVATLSMFTAGYGFAIFVASYFATLNRPDGKQFSRCLLLDELIQSSFP